MPKVTVIAAAYNHEKYVASAIKSLLDQTFQDFELIVTDDGSTDRTVEVIKQFNDPRIKLFVHETNQGVIKASQNSLSHARGEYIAYLTTDDLYVVDKLEKQVKYLDENPSCASVFSFAEIIGEDGDPLLEDNPHKTVFIKNNRSRFEWLNYFFFHGNCLCAPSQMIRKKTYEEVGYCDPRYRQLNDFECHVRVSMKHEIFIIQENLVKFRIRDEQQNMSAPRKDVVIRDNWEWYHILKNFNSISNSEDLIKIFPDLSERKNLISKDLIPFFVAKKAIETGSKIKILFGLNTIFDLLKNDETQHILKNNLKFDYPDFFQLTGQFDIFEIFNQHQKVNDEKTLKTTKVKEKNLFTFPIWKNRKIKISKIKKVKKKR